MEPFKVLVAEDDAHIRRTLQFILEREGWSVLLAENGQQAREVTERDRPDLILMDIMMPGRSGLDVLRDMRKTKELEAVPVILLTAMTDQKDKVRGLEHGADDYLTKPFDPHEVVARVRAQLRIRRLQAELMEAERARVALATSGAAAHEMSQPLTVVMGNIDLLLMKMAADDSLRPIVEAIRQNGQRAVALLRRLQSIQSFETKPYPGHSEILDLERSAPDGTDPAAGKTPGGDPEGGP